MDKEYKDVKVKNRNWRINKFDAKTGSYMIIKVTAILGPILAPVIKGIDINKVKTAADIKVKDFDLVKITSGLAGLTETDFNYVQDKCLSVCSEILPGATVKVLLDNGEFGVIGLEHDTSTVLALTAHALIYNVAGFFEGSPLASIVEGLTSSMPN